MLRVVVEGISSYCGGAPPIVSIVRSPATSRG